MSLFNKTPLEEKEANYRKATKKLSNAESNRNNNTNPKKQKKLDERYAVAKTNKDIARQEFKQELKKPSQTSSNKK